MSIALDCRCGKKLRVKPGYAGKRVKCPGCGEPLLVPPAPVLEATNSEHPVQVSEQLITGSHSPTAPPAAEPSSEGAGPPSSALLGKIAHFGAWAILILSCLGLLMGPSGLWMLSQPDYDGSGPPAYVFWMMIALGLCGVVFSVTSSASLRQELFSSPKRRKQVAARPGEVREMAINVLLFIVSVPLGITIAFFLRAFFFPHDRGPISGAATLSACYATNVALKGLFSRRKPH